MIGPYLTLPEAASLASLTEDDFAARAPQAGILPVAWFGAILYRQADIEASIDRAWQENTHACYTLKALRIRD